MDRLEKRFEQSGGQLYDRMEITEKNEQEGGSHHHKLSPRSENWKKKFLELQLEHKKLKKENKLLKDKLKKYEN